MTTICNLCGHSCNLGPLPGVPEGGRPDGDEKDGKSYHWDEGGLIDAVVVGGYNSTPGNGEGALDDCTNHRFSICEFCLDWLFTIMVIPPRVQGLHDDRPKEVFRPAAQRVAEDDWRKAKNEFYAEAERRSMGRNGR